MTLDHHNTAPHHQTASPWGYCEAGNGIVALEGPGIERNLFETETKAGSATARFSPM